MLGNQICDPPCNIPECGNDHGDCDHLDMEPRELGDDECAMGCFLHLIGNGICDPMCHVGPCQMDGGDCDTQAETTNFISEDYEECFPGCFQSASDGVCDPVCDMPECGNDFGDCVFPNNFECSMGCPWDYLGNGYCEESCNNDLCNFDAPDCAEQNGEVEEEHHEPQECN